jgi:hypothetical protein
MLFAQILRSSEPHLVLVPLSGLGLSILCICIFFWSFAFPLAMRGDDACMNVCQSPDVTK